MPFISIGSQCNLAKVGWVRIQILLKFKASAALYMHSDRKTEKRHGREEKENKRTV